MNRQFKKTCYNPRVLTGRGVIALIGQDCSPSVPEAKKWFTITAELHGTREALIFLGAMAYGGTTPLMKMFVRSKDVNLVEAERLFRAAVAADASPSESYCLFAPAEHGLDIARVDLAALLQSKGGDNALDEAASLLASVLAHDAIPSTQENQLRRPNSEARALKADMIRQEQAPGTLAEALELVEAIPEADRDGLEGSNCEYMLGAIYKALDEEAPNDEHAGRPSNTSIAPWARAIRVPRLTWDSWRRMAGEPRCTCSLPTPRIGWRPWDPRTREPLRT